MGSGGLVVLDDRDCMVDIARYFLRFTQDQSCGKCTFCRIGTRRMLDILDRICSGEGKAGDLEELEQLGRTVGAGSICGLGRTAPNPVLSTLRYFRGEYEAHLAGRCPAGKCKALIAYRVNDGCIGCTLCAQQCPADAIPMTPYVRHVDRHGEVHPLRHLPAGLSGRGGCGGMSRTQNITETREQGVEVRVELSWKHRRPTALDSNSNSRFKLQTIMIRLSIDHRPVEVPPGATVLDAARKLGIDMPALCFREGCDALDLVPGLPGQAHGRRPLRARLRHRGGRGHGGGKRDGRSASTPPRRRWNCC